MFLSVVFVTLITLAATTSGQQQQQNASDIEQFRVVYEWFKLDFAWPDDETKARAFNTGQFIPENTAISGVKFYRDRLYLTVPRWREGVPATLVSIAANPTDKNASPRLEPFPSWSMNQLGNCSSLQFVQSIEIDRDGKLWVLDTGRVNLMSRSEAKCPPKLVVFDLDRVDSYRVIKSYIFPETVVKRDASYLADIVLDATDGGYAYITDGGDADPGIIVYSSREGASWKVRDKRSMIADPAARNFRVNDLAVDIQQNISPIALDVEQQLVYYSPLTSRNLFSIPTSVLKDANRRDAPGTVKDLGTKLGISGSYMMDNRGVLYYGLLDDNGVAKWDTKTPFTQNQHIIAKDDVRLQWPASFGFDNVGNLWLVTNRLQNYIAGHVNVNEPNFRLIRGLTGSKSYLYTNKLSDSFNWSEDSPARTSDKSAAGLTTAGSWAIIMAVVINVMM